MSYPECEKLNERTKEWNAILPFMEWLTDKKIWLAHTITKREYYGEDYEDELMETMVPIPQSLVGLLYEYFEVDPNKLESERRALLKSLRETGADAIEHTPVRQDDQSLEEEVKEE